jgi:hypothetical protein
VNSTTIKSTRQEVMESSDVCTTRLSLFSELFLVEKLQKCHFWSNRVSLLVESCGVVYYESINQEIKIKPIYECRCDEKLRTQTKRFTSLSYTGLVVELEHRYDGCPI